MASLRHETAVADSKLVDELDKVSKQDKKLIKCSNYQTPAIPEMIVQSWKMNEFKYNVVPSPFPSLARGLFTTKVGEPGKDELAHRIVARGYDKFFNIGEVPWTTWAAIEKHTAPPYSMTLKSNGCIIFIGALSPSKILVTSKHSLGPTNDDPNKPSHAQVGERWLVKQLERKGKTTKDIARVLWEKNWTAVAELCDDAFEEHVLPYPPEKSGLHLHGLNDSLGVFKTQPSEKVNEFAREWGLFETPFHVEQTVEKVRAFTDSVGQDGKWKGEPIEGFVVRCYVKDGMTSGDRDAPPYPPGSSFFFKVKYDEPYMMYRDWREITKVVLGGRAPPQSKLRRAESRLYLDWVKEEIKRDRKQFNDYTAGKGIVAVRQKFLDWLDTEEGKSKLPKTIEEHVAGMRISKDQQKSFKKTIITPIAIPGCGKTTVAIALKNLFGFGHVQSDDVQAKKPAPIFIKNVSAALKDHDVVIADKNNHLKQHRDQLRELSKNKEIRLLAFNWALDKPPATVHRICSDRIVGRGDNHQSLRPDTDKNHEDAVWMFISQMQELSDDEVDVVVDMDLTEDIEQSVARAVDACVRVLGVPPPSHEDVGRALSAAYNYAPDKRKEDSKSQQRKAKFRYYCLLPELDLQHVVESGLAEIGGHEETRHFWQVLREKKRLTAVPHVTVVHVHGLPGDQALWNACEALFKDVSSPQFDMKLGHILVDDKVMAITVEELRVEKSREAPAPQIAIDFLSELPKDLKSRLHITVGTMDSQISAVEAGKLVEKWSAGNAGGITVVPLNNVVVKGRMKGLNN